MHARFLMLFAVVAVGACHKDVGPPPALKPAPQASAPAAAKRGPTTGELTAGMVQAVTQGKSQLPVELKFDVLQRPVLGKALEIAIALVPQIAASAATVQIGTAGGLDLGSGANQFDIPSVEAGQVYRHSVHVTPTADGVLLLGLTVSLKHDEITESRVFSIPIIVDSAAQSPGNAH